ncbi:plantaricin C family lantibiotic [Bacillus sp. V2I10]|jgi:mersacidin/lichenicidin family type 2 lantibiotic|uniref:plantaricin C family lantibiotic n=1 Tax=Bacillus sp. V2I10 TaxID=3042276 RepID=UPI00278952E9|nr:plantaricin C family lantibiotic [Bacillus sp. V2I10]MDQ0861133.1 mersacidin/lichenicidin family type 2 lantibiotic [Bacillus sp. V2I10]
MSETIRSWKDPMSRNHTNLNHPAGDVLVELEDQDLLAGVNGGCAWWNVSCHLGNDGRACSLTVECMPTCN